MATEVLASAEAAEDDKALLKRIEALLEDRPRRGTPPTLSAEQICQIVALACEPPFRKWTPHQPLDTEGISG